jgi:hypothetical protein
MVQAVVAETAAQKLGHTKPSEGSSSCYTFGSPGTAGSQGRQRAVLFTKETAPELLRHPASLCEADRGQEQGDDE